MTAKPSDTPEGECNCESMGGRFGAHRPECPWQIALNEQAAAEGDSPEAVESLADDGPECETCGKTTCPDAALPEFSEPRACKFAPIYHAIKDSKDCDYGCSRDFTNQTMRLWVVPAVEEFLARDRAQQRADAHGLVYQDQYGGTCACGESFGWYDRPVYEVLGTHIRASRPATPEGGQHG